MKYSFFAILIFIAGCKGMGKEKYFTGTIEYAYSYASDSLDADSITAARHAKGFFRYDENAYQSRFINPDTTTYYYSGKLNKCISENSIRKGFECEDYGTATDTILSYKLYDTNEKVLGYSCRVIEIQKSRSWVKYYFSRGHTMSPATYQKHKAYNWDAYGTKTKGGLILQLEHRFKLFTMKGVATRIEVENDNFKALEINDFLFTSICK